MLRFLRGNTHDGHTIIHDEHTVNYLQAITHTIRFYQFRNRAPRPWKRRLILPYVPFTASFPLHVSDSRPTKDHHHSQSGRGKLSHLPRVQLTSSLPYPLKQKKKKNPEIAEPFEKPPNLYICGEVTQKST